MRSCGREEWKKFSRYHYLNTSLSNSTQCYGLYDKDEIIGFCAVLHQPHPTNKKIKRCSRIVILPDYQGIGLGYKFLNVVAKRYTRKGYDFSIITSARNFIFRLSKSNKWAMTRLSKSKRSTTGKIDRYRSSLRTNCKTASFFYVNDK